MLFRIVKLQILDFIAFFLTNISGIVNVICIVCSLFRSQLFSFPTAVMNVQVLPLSLCGVCGDVQSLVYICG